MTADTWRGEGAAEAGAGPRWLGHMGFGHLLVTRATHTHTQSSQSTDVAQPHASPRLRGPRATLTVKPSAPLAQAGARSRGAEGGRAEAAQPTQGWGCGTSESVPPSEL